MNVNVSVEKDAQQRLNDLNAEKMRPTASPEHVLKGPDRAEDCFR